MLDAPLSGVQLVKACNTIVAVDGAAVLDDGDIVLRAGQTIVLQSGFSVAAAGKLAVEIDSSLACDTSVDVDGDGWNECVDCHDGDPGVNPGATELCDGVDNDCSGVADDDCVCPPGTSNCDGNPANGCEVDHAATINSCASGTNLGVSCGDTACGSLCPASGEASAVTSSSRVDRFYRAQATECSDCLASLQHRVTLEVPQGIDYDLLVYRDASCVTPVGTSTGGPGVAEEVVVTQPETAGVDSFEYWIRVDYVGGQSCAN